MFIPIFGVAQIISIDPVGASDNDAVTIIYDAGLGNQELAGESKIYMHHGVVTDRPDGTAWKYVKGNWGSDDGVGLMTRVEGQPGKWKISFNPNIRTYFNVPASEDIFRISCVFRSADGSKKGTIPPGEYGWGTVTSNFDIYINLDAGNYIQLDQPFNSYGIYNSNEKLTIRAIASSDVSEMKLWVNNGSGFETRAIISSGKNISYDYTITKTEEIGIKITAKINGVDLQVEKNYDVVLRKPNIEESRPVGTLQGVTYLPDETSVRLCLLAPQKDYVYVVGDFSDWKVKEDLQMKKDGEFFWIDVKNLTPGKPYIYQYWISGGLQVADPYSHQIADPWNDKYIEPEIFPDLPEYRKEEWGIASVLQTGQTPYLWSSEESNWKRPNVDHLVIYELHIRDFLQSHSLKDLTDTLSYLKRLGVNAIELMPVNEFEGNDSWGYNPSFYFAVDKYYGTKNDLKKFIDIAHQQGLAVITDLVLNHSFGQSPMVQMYFDKLANKPAGNNPWFYREYVGPYEWGYDFNHDSQYTKNFVDDVNRFWINEFHFDGFRFDFTKGFTSSDFPFDGYNTSRIALLKRMADKIWEEDPESYVILEHWGWGNEEKELSDYGMKLWSNRSYDFVPSVVGKPDQGSFANMYADSHVSFFSSHDERRIAEHCLSEGKSEQAYNIKSPQIMYERVKMAAVFTYLQPGPKMIWQFDELGYDIDINFNGRTGRKPFVWGEGSLTYYDDELRQYIYQTYQALLNLRKTITPEKLLFAAKDHKETGNLRKLSYTSHDFNLLVFGNFGLKEDSYIPKFTKQGTWYNYMTGDSIMIVNLNQSVTLKPGEWHIYSTNKYSNGFPGVVEFFDNPVSISPFPFTLDEEITITFDAKKASKKSSAGLVNANKVYMHSGIVPDSKKPGEWTNTVGSLQDDGIGQMISKGNDIWEIKIKPRNYYSVPTTETVNLIGMYFRNETNSNYGYGFRNSVILTNVISSEPIVSITPPAFTASTPIRITYHADRGNKELLNESVVYMHSGVSKSDNQTPPISGWQNVIGNWGKDDGIGKMTKVQGTNKWEISFTPADYYNLSEDDFPYWISAVFRSADGNIKGTGPEGPMPNGYISENLDFYLKNYFEELTDTSSTSFMIYPNPCDDRIFFKNISSENLIMYVYDIKGVKIGSRKILTSDGLDVSYLVPGLYILHIIDGENQIFTKFVKL
jgi:glycosidase